MSLVLFIVGPPGSGKTQLACALLSRVQWSTIKFPKWTVAAKVCAIGHYDEDIQFQGGDTVPYHTGEAHCDYWAENLAHMELTIVEGNRFCSLKYPEFFRLGGAHIACIHINADEETCNARRTQRGSKVNPGWMRGRRNMAAGFRAKMEIAGHQCLDLDGRYHRDILLKETLDFLESLGCDAIGSYSGVQYRDHLDGGA